MSRRSSIRASDADRERIADVLRRATAEGRLLAEELEERLEKLLRSRTYGELDALVADLPRMPAPRQRERSRAATLARGTALAAAAVITVSVVLAAVVLVVSGLAFFWAVLAIAWFAFGRGHRGHGYSGHWHRYAYRGFAYRGFGAPRYVHRRPPGSRRIV